MTAAKRDKLKQLITASKHGVPLDTADLDALGISVDLAAYYVRAGWLTRLAHGVYGRTGDTLALHPSLVFLERTIAGLHVGGKSALDWYGVRHYVAQRPVLQLYGWTTAQLPAWFVERFPAHYRRKRLFDEHAEMLLHAEPFESRTGEPRVSSPERAFLEVLSEVGTRQSLQEARELAESTYTARVKVMRDLLQRCRSVKTERLALKLGRELSLPWFAKLEPALQTPSAARGGRASSRKP